MDGVTKERLYKISSKPHHSFTLFSSGYTLILELIKLLPFAECKSTGVMSCSRVETMRDEEFVLELRKRRWLNAMGISESGFLLGIDLWFKPL